MEFRDAAGTLEAFAVEDGGMLRVLRGIAAGDAICIRETGKYARGGDHNGSVRVLRDAAGRAIAKHLDTLLDIGLKAEYSPYAIGDSDINNAREAADALLNAAR